MPFLKGCAKLSARGVCYLLTYHNYSKVNTKTLMIWPLSIFIYLGQDNFYTFQHQHPAFRLSTCAYNSVKFKLFWPGKLCLLTDHKLFRGRYSSQVFPTLSKYNTWSCLRLFKKEKEREREHQHNSKSLLMFLRQHHHKVETILFQQ